ncbi:hypothetical protein [Treponema primitia]|nr:hypothetical protein [Treponema primitia]
MLDKGKIQRALGITLPPWEKSLGEYIKTCVH